MEKKSPVSSNSISNSRKSVKGTQHKSLSYMLKVILLGDSHTGKTSLLEKYCSDENENVTSKHRSQRYIPTTYEKKVLRQEGSALLQINDTAGQERYRSLTHSYYRGAQGCLIVFDVASETSLHNVCNWVQDLKYYYNIDQDQLSTFLVGTVRHNCEREVTKEKAEKFAEHLDIPYIELELDNKCQIIDLFDKLADSMIEKCSARLMSVSQAQVSVANLSKYYTKATETWNCTC